MIKPAYVSRFIFFVIFVVAIGSVSAMERKTEWTVSAGGYVWCGTENGLYRFDSEEEIWSRVEPVDIPVEEVKFYDERLWVGGYGLMTADPELGDWLKFTKSTGLPGNNYRSLYFGDEYYYIGAESGAARFDPILEEWESLSGVESAVCDIASAGDYIFLAADSGIYRYDREYERTAPLGAEEGLAGGRYRWIQELPGEIWFIGENAIDIYQPDSRSWISLKSAGGVSPGSIIQILVDGERLWMLTEKAVLWCYWRGRDFQVFPRSDRLAGYKVREIAGGNGTYYFATDRGLMIYRESEERWELVDRTMGLEAEEIQRLSVVGQLIFLRSAGHLEVYSLSERRFLPALELGSAEGILRKEGRWSWDDRGLGGDVLGGDLRLKGAYSYISQFQETAFINDRNRILLYPSYGFTGRRISGFYDNTDQDEILYGASFRGLRDDNFRRAEFGNRVDFRLDNNRLLGETTVEGIQGSVEYGPRSPIRGRRALKLDGTYGATAARSASDILFGQGDALYQLSHKELRRGSARVYINGEEIPRTDYVLSNVTGTLNFTFPGAELLDENDKIRVDYQYLLDVGEGEDFAGGDLTLSQGDNLSEAFSYYESDTLSAGRTSAELRGNLGGIDLRFIPQAAFSSVPETEEGFAAGGEFYGKAGNWLLSTRAIRRDENFESLDPAMTEFGALRDETAAQIGYESQNFNSYAEYYSRGGAYGGEDTYKLESYYIPLRGLSVFSKAAARMADSDSLKRDHREMNFGGAYSLGDDFLRRIKFRRLDIYSEFRIGRTDREYPLSPDSAASETGTRSMYLRTVLAPGSKINLTPELRMVNKSRSLDGGPEQPFKRSTMFRGTGNILEILPGLQHFFRWRGEYNRENFAFSRSDVYLFREGYFSTEFLPSRWWDGFSSFNFGLTFYRANKDSLLDAGEGIVDLWGQKGDYSFFSSSDALRVSAYPAGNWEITEVITSSRGTGGRRFQSQTIAWRRGEESQLTGRFYYTLDQAVSESATYQPSLELHRRWSRGLLTRFSIAGYYRDDEAGDEVNIIPSIYFDKQIRIFIRNGSLQVRNDFRPFFKKTTGIRLLRQAGFTNSLNIDVKFSSKLIIRLISQYEYAGNLDENEGESNYETEFRATIKF